MPSLRIFKAKAFQRFVRKEAIEDAVLMDAVNRAEKGQIDANLGGGVIKQRIARPGEGKSGGYRMALTDDQLTPLVKSGDFVEIKRT